MRRLNEIFNNEELLINTQYERSNDVLTLTMKNIHTGKKRLIVLPEPETLIYITKDTNPKEYKEYESINRLEARYVKEAFKEYNIARVLGIRNFADKVRSKSITSKDIYLNKRLFSADIPLEDSVVREYKKYFTREENGTFKTDLPFIDELHLGGLDIETDINVSDNPLEQPVIINTYVDGKTWTVYSKCLINEEFKGQKEIMEDINSFYKELHLFLVNHINTLDTGNEKKNSDIKKLLLSKIENMKYNISFTTEEKEVILDVNKHVFSKVNPDFLLIYNASYDINHQINRCKALQIPEEELFRYKDMNTYMYINTNNMNPELKDRRHYFDVRNPTKIIDQMLLYYQLRRAKLFPKYSLDATAKREVGLGKLDYSKICNYIGDFPYVDYKSFLIYNIIDVLAMLFIDLITNDVFAQLYRRFNMCTEWSRVVKPLDATTNAFEVYYQMKGFIPSCNVNALFADLKSDAKKAITKNNPGLINVINQIQKVKTSKKEDNPYRIEGGLVTSPNLLSNKIKENSIYKIPIKTFNKFYLSADLDATSMYPSNTQVNNASKTTLVGRIESIDHYTEKDLGRKCILSLINRNIANVGSNFFGLPLLHDLINQYHHIDNKVEEEKSLYYNTEDEVPFFITKENKNAVKDIKRLWRNNYRTKYDDKDVSAGSPSSNKLFMTSDKNVIEFSYYSSKVEIKSDRPFNEILNISGANFVCGFLRGDTIINKNDEYQELLIPRKEEFTTKCQTEGWLTGEQIDGIEGAKKMIYHLKIVDYTLSVVDRMIFFSRKVNPKIRYEIYDILEDPNLFKIVFYSDYKTKNVNIDITQSFIAYKISKEE